MGVPTVRTMEAPVPGRETGAQGLKVEWTGKTDPVQHLNQQEKLMMDANDMLREEAKIAVDELQSFIQGGTGDVRPELIRQLKYRMLQRCTDEMGYFVMSGNEHDAKLAIHRLDDIISIEE